MVNFSFFGDSKSEISDLYFQNVPDFPQIYVKFLILIPQRITKRPWNLKDLAKTVLVWKKAVFWAEQFL